MRDVMGVLLGRQSNAGKADDEGHIHFGIPNLAIVCDLLLRTRRTLPASEPTSIFREAIQKTRIERL